MKTVSVIIPMYNSENYLDVSLKTIMNQSFNDIEIICIDDCSSDNTLERLYKEQQRDNRIRIIHNTERMGAAYCRNLGLEQAIGAYTIFLDSDDRFETTMIDSIIQCAKKNDADIFIYDYIVAELLDSKVEQSVKYESSYRNSRYKRQLFNYKNIESFDILLLSTAPWNKMIKTEFLKKKRLLFQSISSSNDVMFSLLSFVEAESIKIVESEKPLLTSYIHSSINRISNNRNPYSEYLAINGLFRIARKRKYDKKKVELLFIKALELLITQFVTEEGTGEYYTFLKEEGIDSLYESGGKELIEVSDRLNNPFNLFKNKQYDEKWYMYFDLFFLNNNNDIWKKWTKEKKILIWGAGNYGKKTICSAYLNKRKIEVWVDTDLHKTGTRFMGIEVQNNLIERIKTIEMIIVAFDNVTSEIVDFLNGLGKEILYVKDYI